MEAALSIYLESFAKTLGSREQLAIAEFADALLVIPKTLAVNAGKVGALPDHFCNCPSSCHARQHDHISAHSVLSLERAAMQALLDSLIQHAAELTLKRSCGPIVQFFVCSIEEHVATLVFHDATGRDGAGVAAGIVPLHGADAAGEEALCAVRPGPGQRRRAQQCGGRRPGARALQGQDRAGDLA